MRDPCGKGSRVCRGKFSDSLPSVGGRRFIRDASIKLGEKDPVVCLGHLPRRVPQHYVESAFRKHLGKCQGPMEELILLRQFRRRIYSEWVWLSPSVANLKPHIVCWCRVLKRARLHWPYKCCAPGVGDQSLMAVSIGVEEVLPVLFLPSQCFDVGIWRG